ncbi:hypothetical protein GGR56DRAFT_669493 [Xylariaceae sp. FL0804]|nr:hypothetical protein GGR56DRAFT_669493 [Xylariaceae sp. FL0804]
MKLTALLIAFSMGLLSPAHARALSQAADVDAGSSPGHPVAFEPANLNSDVEVLTTMDAVRAFGARFNETTRVEDVAGQYVLIDATTGTHVGTIEGDAHAYMDALGRRRGGSQHELADDAADCDAQTKVANASAGGPGWGESLAVQSRCSAHSCLQNQGCKSFQCTMCIFFWCA